MHLFKRLHIAYIMTLLVVFFVVTQPTTKSFRLNSTNIKNNSSGVPANNPVIFEYSHLLDGTSPYAKFVIAPKTDGSIKSTNSKITFTPEQQLAANTTYTIVVTGVKSVTGQTLDSFLSFKTGVQKLSEFEKSLPIVSDSYTIDRLDTGQILVLVTAPPADLNAQAALKFLQGKGVDTSKILVQKTLSSRN